MSVSVVCPAEFRRRRRSSSVASAVVISWVSTTEPPFAADTTLIRQGARRVQRRRTAIAAAVGAVVLVGAGFGGQALTSAGQRLQPSESQPVAATPAEYVRGLERLAGVTTPFRPNLGDAVQAFDADARPLRGEARRDARRWQGQFLLTEGHVLDINVVDAVSDRPPGDLTDFLSRECGVNLSLPDPTDEFPNLPDETCEVEEVSGDAVQYTERVAKPLHRGWIRMLSGNPPPGDEAFYAVGSTWFIQQVQVLRDSFPVVVTEAVRAPTITDARTRFAYSRDELVDLATSESLPFPLAAERVLD